MMKRPFMPHGILAIPPSAFAFMFDMVKPEPPQNQDGIAVVTVRGPLVQHQDWCFDSYDALRDRVKTALSTNPKAVVLSIDSPGGVVNGCFETARAIKDMAKQARIPLLAYVDGQATSAAYALACAADRIYTPETGTLGSIGVIDAMVDLTAQDQMMGMKYTLIASGKRKTDGNPHAPTAEDAVAASQSRVDSLAAIFHGWVAEARGVDVAMVRGLEAGLYHGAEAVRLGLADAVGGFDQLLASIAAGTAGGSKMSKAYEDAIGALRKAAASDDEQEAKKAKRMLAAELEEDEPEATDEPSDKEEPAAEDDKEETEASTAEVPEDKDAKAKAAKASATVSATTTQAIVEKAVADALKLERMESEEKTKLLALAPKSLRAVLADKPLSDVKAIVEALPKPAKPASPTAPTAVVPTRGAGQGDPLSAPSSPDALAMDQAMGLRGHQGGIKREGTAMVFGVISKAEAEAITKKHG